MRESENIWNLGKPTVKRQTEGKRTWQRKLKRSGLRRIKIESCHGSQGEEEKRNPIYTFKNFYVPTTL